MADHTGPSKETRDAEAAASSARHGADREPSPEEEHDAESNEVDPAAAQHEKEMNRIGAEQKGEGRTP